MARRIRSIYVVIVAILIIPIPLFLWPYMWEGEFLGKWSSVVTILSLVGVPVAYFVRQYEKEQEMAKMEVVEKARASKNLRGELLDTLEAIKGKEFPDDLIDLKVGDTTITFMNRFLNHDIYDSLVFSGGIKFLDYKIQQKIQDIFNIIKHHNRYLRFTIENRGPDGRVSEIVLRYYELLDKYEKQMLEKIPPMIEYLRDRSTPS